MATTTMATAAGAAAILYYYTHNKKFQSTPSSDDYEDSGEPKPPPSGTSGFSQRLMQAPAMWLETISTSPIGDLAVRINLLLKRQGVKCGGKMGGCEGDLVSKPQEELRIPSGIAPDIEEALYGVLKNLDLEENRKEKKNDNNDEKAKADFVAMEEKIRMSQYPQRCNAEDCPHYLRTGTCKFGLNCKFNHPVRWKNQDVEEKERENEELPATAGQHECKYYLRAGGCKFGKACRYNHPGEKTVIGPPLELNFLGLPIRPGEKECPFYMRTGSCKYASNCRFHHPNPTAVGECDPPSSGYHNGGSVSFHSTGISQPAVAYWSSPRTFDETVPYFDTSSSYVPLVPSPPQEMYPNPEWNGYQAPVYPPERNMHPPSASVMNNPMKKTDVSTHHQQQVVVEEFPERPGQRECIYFRRTGYCKFRSACKYHHPKNQLPNSPVGVHSDKCLPLRPVSLFFLLD
ncbi:hypothetical protein HHK36_029508 [Tetracentron sinense]|uniref:C3H1-type domain-containing protein n=1 Tax=Tetracentron sinense TaxID=13715 RepID=A0A834Y9R6_TETSI|nr:hypothetical protein HHK36_029508 [Tetracentron sinense]